MNHAEEIRQAIDDDSFSTSPTRRRWKRIGAVVNRGYYLAVVIVGLLYFTTDTLSVLQALGIASVLSVLWLVFLAFLMSKMIPLLINKAEKIRTKEGG
ncbi:MAG: hypothetical protein A3D67_01025 [Candidatus Lloydbacteria bacterium RIFCSPHIGHO2_02_FULL_51_22]|uniref:2TM domain-containing protein n=2 Tax=Candidatus Lloydiibacteriota TaxID=1817910 RepID=A0A1G2D7Q6_9BACT|nr:MAG: hypothetical protein A3D67_01025 [Candidatus Lloydbacteria bacterium RIFCSPHIGHO2_02_FULL_51_22]OGZ15029.1 MAG: hypothetical protein A3J08_01635 [Candidatus Lloydbacteria bacterium RIFCSPLOWO2_02_FULL_51_11]